MKEDIKQLKLKFNEIKIKGWIESDKSSFENAGITFEKLVGIPTNQFEIPDFGSIELKTKSSNNNKNNYVSLFNCVPTGPHYHEVERLKNLFGYPDSELKIFNVFYGKILCNKLTKIGKNFYFKLNVCRKTQKITLCVYDRQYNKIEETTYWDFDILEEKLYRKLKFLALIDAKKKIINGKTFFKYNTLKLFKLKEFDDFINLLENGAIKINFKIGVFKDKKRLGKIHDRGTAFVIESTHISKLFDPIK